MCVYVYNYECVHVSMCVCVFMYVCVYLCMCVYMNHYHGVLWDSHTVPPYRPLILAGLFDSNQS